MYPKLNLFLITQDAERRREREWQELLHRPDAPPLPPEEPTIEVGTRLAATIRGWLQRLPADKVPPARIWSSADEVRTPEERRPAPRPRARPT
jgi:hypothetical protein